MSRSSGSLCCSFCWPGAFAENRLSDVDLAIAKDPLPLLLAEGQEPFVADVQVQVDALDKDPSTSFPVSFFSLLFPLE